MIQSDICRLLTSERLVTLAAKNRRLDQRMVAKNENPMRIHVNDDIKNKRMIGYLS